MVETVFSFQPALQPSVPPDLEDYESGYSAFFPRDVSRTKGPEQSQFVCACAWTFSRFSERREGYFIGRATTAPFAWVLWRLAFDDEWETWSWGAYAATSEAFVDPAEAARTLLGFGWEHERETWGTLGPDEVEDYGLLHTIEVEDIMTRVFGTEWPRIADDEDDAA
jgi:hypothetical protein